MHSVFAYLVSQYDSGRYVQVSVLVVWKALNCSHLVEHSARDPITVSLAVLVSCLRIESSSSLLPLQPALLYRALLHTNHRGGYRHTDWAEAGQYLHTIIISFMLREINKKSISPWAPCPLFSSAVKSWDDYIHSSFIPLMRQISGPAWVPSWARGESLIFASLALMLLGSSPWKLEQQSIEIW